MTPITFEVLGRPVGKGNHKAVTPKGWSRPVIIEKNSRTRVWQDAIALQARLQARGELFTGAVALSVVFYLPRPVSLPRRVVLPVKKPDLDKLLRTVFDSLTGIVVKDDAQIVEVSASKVYVLGSAVPRALITITES